MCRLGDTGVEGWGEGMNNGIVKWFNPTKGYGFVTDDAGGADLFVHRRDVISPEDGALMEGDRVGFDRTDTPRGGAAVNVMRDITNLTILGGTVKWFNTTKGFGFVMPDAGGADLFMHQDNLRMGGHLPQEGDRVTYEMMQTVKGSAARNVIRVATRASDADDAADLAMAAYKGQTAG